MKFTGKLLQEYGFEPGPHYRELIEEGGLRLAKGESIEEILKDFSENRKPAPKLEMRDVPLDIKVASAPETDSEKSNIAAALVKIQELSRVPIVKSAALMPDTCPAGGGYACIPVGGVVVTENAIIPSAHSADICCSMFASFFESDRSVSELMDAIQESTLFGPFARKEEHPNFPISFFKEKFQGNQFLEGLEEMASKNMQTQGDGNHFAFLGEIEITENLVGEISNLKQYLGKTLKVLVTHHGSRNLGARLYKRGQKAAVEYTKTVANNIPDNGAWLNTKTDIGKEYLVALHKIKDWTIYNHDQIHLHFLGNIGTRRVSNIWNAHNFIWVDGDNVLHGKGATPAWGNSLGLIPLNMGNPILIVSGGDNKEFLSFAPHGAGRNISRSELVRQHDTDGRGVGPRKIQEILDNTAKNLDIRWASGKPDLSETPIAYKNPNQIKEQIQQFNLANIIGEIKPLGCLMAGEFRRFGKRRKK